MGETFYFRGTVTD